MPTRLWRFHHGMESDGTANKRERVADDDARSSATPLKQKKLEWATRHPR